MGQLGHGDAGGWRHGSAASQMGCGAPVGVDLQAVELACGLARQASLQLPRLQSQCEHEAHVGRPAQDGVHAQTGVPAVQTWSWQTQASEQSRQATLRLLQKGGLQAMRCCTSWVRALYGSACLEG